MSAAPLVDAPIRVLVVEDSTVMRMLLVHVLEEDPRLTVLEAVESGAAALEAIARQAPDVVLMDIHMDGMDGFETARRIMETRPVPIVMCSAVADPTSVATSFRAYEAGAVAVVAKPVSVVHPDFERQAGEMVQTLRLMAEVKVVRRWPKKLVSAPAAAAPARGASPRIEVVGIGASTGGPPALQTLLAALPADFAAPILVVQHITAGFLPGLVEWLRESTPLHVEIARHGAVPAPGHAYLAPDDHHMALDAHRRIRLTREPAEHGVRPAADRLFASLATHVQGRAVGVLLTGMGKDGALGLRAMRDAGATTIAQDRDSCVVYGMPGAAVALGAAGHVLPIERIAGAVCRAVYPDQRPDARRPPA
jgi:two-component system chemotaxis response regulator CheB